MRSGVDVNQQKQKAVLLAKPHIKGSFYQLALKQTFVFDTYKRCEPRRPDDPSTPAASLITPPPPHIFPSPLDPVAPPPADIFTPASVGSHRGRPPVNTLD